VPRHSFQPTDEQRKLVKSLSALGLCQNEICHMVRLRSPKTLRKHFRQELASGMAEANTAVARVAYEMAHSGRYPAMTFFWAKCQRKRVEQVEELEPMKPYKVEIRFPGKEGVPGYGSEASHAAV
jgi:hypothetical protein